MAREERECPYCGKVGVLTDSELLRETNVIKLQSAEGNVALELEIAVCPSHECQRMSIQVGLREWHRSVTGGGLGFGKRIKTWALMPESSARVFPSYVPAGIRTDYEEACKLVSLSPKASATLSRRALQGMIRDFWKVTGRTLKDEIDQLEKLVDAQTWAAIDAVRQVGNIGAHMEKDVNILIDVDAYEAEKLVRLFEVLVEQWYVREHEKNVKMQAVIELAKNKKEERERGKDASSGTSSLA